jgi:hypothetical protein
MHTEIKTGETYLVRYKDGKEYYPAICTLVNLGENCCSVFRGERLFLVYTKDIDARVKSSEERRD